MKKLITLAITAILALTAKADGDAITSITLIGSEPMAATSLADGHKYLIYDSCSGREAFRYLQDTNHVGGNHILSNALARLNGNVYVWVAEEGENGNWYFKNESNGKYIKKVTKSAQSGSNQGCGEKNDAEAFSVTFNGSNATVKNTTPESDNSLLAWDGNSSPTYDLAGWTGNGHAIKFYEINQERMAVNGVAKMKMLQSLGTGSPTRNFTTKIPLTFTLNANNWGGTTTNDNVVIFRGSNANCVITITTSNANFYVSGYSFGVKMYTNDGSNNTIICNGDPAVSVTYNNVQPINKTLELGTAATMTLTGNNKGFEFSDFYVYLTYISPDDRVRNDVINILVNSSLYTREEAGTMVPEGTQYFTSAATDVQINTKITEVLESLMPQVRTKLAGKQIVFRSDDTANGKHNNYMSVKKSEAGALEGYHTADFTLGAVWTPTFSEDGKIKLENIYHETYLNSSYGYNESGTAWTNNTTPKEWVFKFSAAKDGSFTLADGDNGANVFNSGVLGVWSSTAADHKGSYWMVSFVTNEMDALSNALLASAPANTEAHHVNTTNGHDATLAAAVSALTEDKSSVDNYKSLEDAIANADVIAFNPSLFYHIKSVGRQSSQFAYAYIKETDNDWIYGNLTNAADNPYSFIRFDAITIDGDDNASIQKYNIACNDAYYGGLSNSAQNQHLGAVNDIANAGKYYLEHVSEGMYWIKDNDVTLTHPSTGAVMNMIHPNSSGWAQNMSEWENTSKWYIEPAEKVNIALNQEDNGEYYGLGFFPFDVEATAGVTLYTIREAKDKQNNPVVTYDEISVAKAGTPFMVKSTANKATLNIVYPIENPQPEQVQARRVEPAGNSNVLSGSLRSAAYAAGDYVLENGDQGLGFYRKDEAGTISSNSAFIAATSLLSSTQAAAPANLIMTNPSNTSALEELSTINSQLSTIYDLQGRRLSAPVKGINIINGRKILKK